MPLSHDISVTWLFRSCAYVGWEVNGALFLRNCRIEPSSYGGEGVCRPFPSHFIHIIEESDVGPEGGKPPKQQGSIVLVK